ncbi:MBL fold metallo-hydrolase [Streptomyces sp. BH097]|uniref:MBL fold metallo-hydrolase n=1 Tax=unclassified Streptomyces TaxID=2593676 RepID=UPI003BB55EFC
MAADTTGPGKLTELAEDVYAYVQPPGGWCVSNAGVIAGSDGAVVVDTLATLRRAGRLAACVDGLGVGPRRTLVNTHHHGDHTFGNSLYGTAAEVIVHERAVAELIETGLALTRLWPDVEWGEVEVARPTLTFADQIELTVGERRLELCYVGPAHTTNDIVVWLPDSRVLFAGDVVLAGSTPFALMGSIDGSLKAIERLRGLRPRVVVCGHGPVGGPEVLDENEAYLRRVRRIAAEALSAGLTPLDAAREAGPGAFAHLLDPERLVGNLHRAYAELRGGEPGAALDVPSVFGEMVDYNGGRLPHCLA